MDDEKALLPCPFCGAPGEIEHSEQYGWWQAQCSNCGVTCSECDINSHADAVARWNTRATPSGWVSVPVEPTAEMIQAMNDRMHEGADYIAENSIEYALFAAVYKAMIAAAPHTGER